MNDFFDHLMSLDLASSTDPRASMPVLVVSEPAKNAAQMDALAACANEIATLNLPVVFEDEDGKLENPADFAVLVTRLGRKPTADEACAYIDGIREPILDKWRPLIEAAGTGITNASPDCSGASIETLSPKSGGQ